MGLTDRATAVYERPAERIHLDWYDGIVQAVLLHDQHGPWYAFALGVPAPGERALCLRPIVDRSVVPEVEELETLDDVEWLLRLGTDRLLPACGPEGVWLRVIGDRVVEARRMTAGEVAASRPVAAEALWAT
jgi:hypothetical protein